MGVPYYGTDMTSHPQYITVRNERGRVMLDTVKPRLSILPTVSTGDRTPFVMQTVLSDDACASAWTPSTSPTMFEGRAGCGQESVHFGNRPLRYVRGAEA